MELKLGLEQSSNLFAEKKKQKQPQKTRNFQVGTLFKSQFQFHHPLGTESGIQSNCQLPGMYRVSQKRKLFATAKGKRISERTKTTPKNEELPSWNFVQVPISIPSPTGWETCILLNKREWKSTRYKFPSQWVMELKLGLEQSSNLEVPRFLGLFPFAVANNFRF
jgi:hypothetical protein